MQFDEDIAKEVVHLTSDDGKMLLLNDRYYCLLTHDDKSLEVPEHFCFFSENMKDFNSPSYTSYTDCYVLDIEIEKGHHKNQFAKLYRTVHKDLGNASSFSLMLADKSLLSITKIEIVDKPYQLKNLIDKLDVKPKADSKQFEPIMSIDGVCFIDFGEYNGKAASMEYYINGRLYFEIVDFNNIADMGIVDIDDDSRRNVVVDMFLSDEVLNESNADKVARLINVNMKRLKKELEDDNRS